MKSTPVSAATSPLPSDLLPPSEWPDLWQAISGRSEKAVRVRPTTALGTGEPMPLPFPADPVPWYPSGFLAGQTLQPGRFLQHAAGAYFVQDAGSMLALRLLDPQPHELVADACASPGAKASAILEIVGPGGGFLLANEPIRGRQPALLWNLARVGFPRFAVTQLDPEVLADATAEMFDAVLVDAPCTGQTLVGRGKQKPAAFSPKQIAHAAARQQRILHQAARMVRPGGRLVYSTCTFAVEENEEIAATLVSDGQPWRVEPVADLAPWLSPRWPGGYRVWPHRDRSAGAYAILLRRTDGDQRPLGARRAIDQGGGARITGRAGALPMPMEEFGRLTPAITRGAGRQWFGWPEDAPEEICSLALAGPELVYQPAKVWNPAHALALRRDSDWDPARVVDVDDQQAQRYLQGDVLPAAAPGWSVVRWRGHPLGWVHSNALRANNALPAAARVAFVPPTGIEKPGDAS